MNVNSFDLWMKLRGAADQVASGSSRRIIGDGWSVERDFASNPLDDPNGPDEIIARIRVRGTTVVQGERTRVEVE